jgi:hypothetical protein
MAGRDNHTGRKTMTNENLYLAGEGEGRQSPRDAALDRAIERLNIDWKGQFSTVYGPIQAYYFFWDRMGDVDYLNLEIVFSKNPKVCYQSLKRTIGKRHENFYNKDLLRLSLECVSAIFETVKKEGKIMRENGTMTEDTDKIASVSPKYMANIPCLQTALEITKETKYDRKLHKQHLHL